MNVIAWGFPQWIAAAVVLLNLACSGWNNGKPYPDPRVRFSVTLASAVAWTWLLAWGGFWS